MALFFFHWYEGEEPPLVGVAVNVTLVPAQMVCAPAVIAALTEGVNTGFTVMVIPALLAVLGLAQTALLLTTQTITSLFANAASV